MDVEVSCSGYGFTKEMENDLLQEYGITDGEASDTDVEEETTVPRGQDEGITEYTVDELSALRQQVDAEVQLTTAKPNTVLPVASRSKSHKEPEKFDSIANYIQSLTSDMDSVQFVEPIVDCLSDTFDNARDISAVVVPLSQSNPMLAGLIAATATKTVPPQHNDKNDSSVSCGASSVSSTDLQEAQDDLADLDKNSREYRSRMMDQVKVMLEARSQRSYSTTASTIAPTVIKDRIKKTIELKDQRDVRKRCLAKGEANATTRGRKENKDTVKEYAGWDF